MSSEKSDAEYAGNYHPDKLYKTEWGKGAGAYVSVVFEEDEQTPAGVEILTKPRAQNRVKVRLSWVKKRNEIAEIEIKKFKEYKNKGWQEVFDEEGYAGIKIQPVTFGLIVEFLRVVSELDINEIKQRRLSLSVDGDVPLDDEMKKKLRSYLTKEGGGEFIAEVLETGFLQSGDIVNAGYRRGQLQQFESMLSNKDALLEYARKIGVSEKKEEKIWQRFFEQNQWIFGYGLDYRFEGLLQAEPSMASPEADGTNVVISDYLFGDSRFMTFVELKKPTTPLFANSKNRSGAWSLSSDLFDSVSQILEQKASGEIFFTDVKHDADGKEIQAKPYDSKVILIIGDWAQLEGSSDLQKQMKTKTLERFRRDSRNVEILTYDELLDRAKFIVEHSPSTKN